MKNVNIKAAQTIRYDQIVKMKDDDYKKLTGEIPCEFWEKDAIIESYINKINIFDWDELDEIEIDDVTDIYPITD